MSSWYHTTAPNDDVAVGIRLRLCRNLKGYPFAHRMNDEQQDAVNALIESTLFDGDDSKSDDFEILRLDTLSDVQRGALCERGILPKRFFSDCRHKIILLSNDETVSILVNFEDHVRLQVLVSGLQFEKAYQKLSEWDDRLCTNLPIAFHEQLGFLTACPTNLGTGLKCSALLHLPGLEAAGEIGMISESVSRIGLSFKAFLKGDMALYEVSNQITMGITERTAIGNLQAITEQVVARERAARKLLDPIEIEDAACRALAVLKSARKLKDEELGTMLSDLKLGIAENLTDALPNNLPTRLYIESRPNMMRLESTDEAAADRPHSLAQFIRNTL